MSRISKRKLILLHYCEDVIKRPWTPVGSTFESLQSLPKPSPRRQIFIPSLMKKWRLPLSTGFWSLIIFRTLILRKRGRIKLVWQSKSHRQGPSLKWIDFWWWILKWKFWRWNTQDFFFFFSAALFLHWGFWVYKNEYFNQTSQFITVRRRRSLMERENLVDISYGTYCNKSIYISTSYCVLWLLY